MAAGKTTFKWDMKPPKPLMQFHLHLLSVVFLRAWLASPHGLGVIPPQNSGPLSQLAQNWPCYNWGQALNNVQAHARLAERQRFGIGVRSAFRRPGSVRSRIPHNRRQPGGGKAFRNVVRRDARKALPGYL